MSSITDLYKKILFTFFLLCVYRFGSYIPVAGVNSFVLHDLVSQNQSGILGMFNTLSGGSLGRMSIFALAIMPYITASIVMQLMTMCYEPIANLKKDGEIGRRKISQYSRYLTVFIAAFNAYGISSGLIGMKSSLGSVVVISPMLFKFTAVVTLVVGTVFLMWLGEQISLHGIGNGTSLIIFVGIVAGLPSAIISSFEMIRTGIESPIWIFFITTILIALVVLIVFFERAQRRIVLQYSKRQMGNKVYGGQSSHIPLKLNTAGVIPPIFASAILLFPLTIANFSGSSDGFLSSLVLYLNRGQPLFVLLYIVLIIFFSFLYTSIIFNPTETAENLRKYGAYIPGRRPGSYTAEYLDYVLSRLTVIGSMYLACVCVIPELLISKFSSSFALGGTSLLIVVNVVMDSFVQVQTHLFSNRYDKMMKKMQNKKLS